MSMLCNFLLATETVRVPNRVLGLPIQSAVYRTIFYRKDILLRTFKLGRIIMTQCNNNVLVTE